MLAGLEVKRLRFSTCRIRNMEIFLRKEIALRDVEISTTGA